MDTDGFPSFRKEKIIAAEASEQEKERKDSAGCFPPFKQQNNQLVTTRRHTEWEKEGKKQALPPFGRQPGVWFSPAAVGSSHYCHHN
jgi:hypothetical protein